MQDLVGSIENSKTLLFMLVYFDVGIFLSLFDNPEQTERRSYALYWQKKLSSNKDILFPDTLADSSAALTAGFSFAYLKEALCVA